MPWQILDKLRPRTIVVGAGRYGSDGSDIPVAGWSDWSSAIPIPFAFHSYSSVVLRRLNDSHRRGVAHICLARGVRTQSDASVDGRPFRYCLLGALFVEVHPTDAEAARPKEAADSDAQNPHDIQYRTECRGRDRRVDALWIVLDCHFDEDDVADEGGHKRKIDCPGNGVANILLRVTAPRDHTPEQREVRLEVRSVHL